MIIYKTSSSLPILSFKKSVNFSGPINLLFTLTKPIILSLVIKKLKQILTYTAITIM